MSHRPSQLLVAILAAAVVLGGCSTTAPAGPASQVSAGVVVVVGSASGGLTVDDTSADMPIPATSASGAVDVPAEPDGGAPSGGLTIPRLGFDQPVAEEVSWGTVLRPVGRGLATVTDIPAPWDAGQLYLIHSGGVAGNPGNLLVEKDGGSLLVVGDVVTLPDGSPGVVTRAEVAPKDDLPEWLWTALAEGRTVLVTCRPETGRQVTRTNAIVAIERA